MRKKVSKHKRNTEGLKDHAKKKREDAFQRCDDAIRELLRKRLPVNFQQVANLSGCSVTWLYKEEKVRSRIEHLRTEHKPKKITIPKAEQTTVESLRSLIINLKETNKKLREQNEELKQQNEKIYGILIANKFKFTDE